ECRFDSIDALSAGSGKFSSSSMSSTVLPASERSSCIRWFRKFRKNSISLLVTLGSSNRGEFITLSDSDVKSRAAAAETGKSREFSRRRSRDEDASEQRFQWL